MNIVIDMDKDIYKFFTSIEEVDSITYKKIYLYIIKNYINLIKEYKEINIQFMFNSEGYPSVTTASGHQLLGSFLDYAYWPNDPYLHARNYSINSVMDGKSDKTSYDGDILCASINRDVVRISYRNTLEEYKISFPVYYKIAHDWLVFIKNYNYNGYIKIDENYLKGYSYNTGYIRDVRAKFYDDGQIKHIGLYINNNCDDNWAIFLEKGIAKGKAILKNSYLGNSDKEIYYNGYYEPIDHFGDGDPYIKEPYDVWVKKWIGRIFIDHGDAIISENSSELYNDEKSLIKLESLKKEHYFEDFDFSLFWDNDEYSMREYVGEEVTDSMIQDVELELGYKLPASYIDFIKYQNGGIPKNTNYRTREPTSWAEDHISITGIYGIDKNKTNSLCGEYNSKFWIEEWGYPDIGIYICDCPSAGHNMVCLDYSICGPKGEPQVVYIDQELNYKKSVLAVNFGTFIRGLEPDQKFD